MQALPAITDSAVAAISLSDSWREIKITTNSNFVGKLCRIRLVWINWLALLPSTHLANLTNMDMTEEAVIVSDLCEAIPSTACLMAIESRTASSIGWYFGAGPPPVKQLWIISLIKKCLYVNVIVNSFWWKINKL